MSSIEYPEILNKYDQRAINQQKTFINTLLCNWGILAIVSLLALFPNNKVTIAITIVLLTLKIWFNTNKQLNGIPEERDWYINRAYAESLKSVFWKFCMKTKGYRFNNDEVLGKMKIHISEILRGAKNPAKVEDSDIEDLLSKAKKYRDMSWNERKDVYIKNRIKDQLAWYKNKATWNKKRSSCFDNIIKYLTYIYVVSLIIAFFALLLYPESQWEKLITSITNAVCGTPILIFTGWIQAKKYNELSQSYSYTAEEIEVLLSKEEETKDECSFGHWVENSEVAFSREHTNWAARRNIF